MRNVYKYITRNFGGQSEFFKMEHVFCMNKVEKRERGEVKD